MPRTARRKEEVMMPLAQSIVLILLWGLIATLLMTSVLVISQNIGWSRLNMPYLLGAFFTGDRHEANVLGLMLYMLAGWLFAFLYYLIFSVVGAANWWIGGMIGFVHAMLLLSLALPTLSYVHPRVASEYQGPDTRRTLEPPGFLGLHYGYRTPVVLLLAQTSYGVILGVGFASFFR
jgi:hypothetical protein